MKPAENIQTSSDTIQNILNMVNAIIVDKHDVTKLCLTTILAQGHLLIEDAPGMGKTSLLKALSKVLGLESQRIQFTNDLLPGDILGTQVFDKEANRFQFHPGPIFSNFVIADEINRASPKTQSACLQAMEEYRVNSDRETFELPRPFFVVATQNPLDDVGTFPLPDSQLDRFLMKVEVGLPSREAEKEILVGRDRVQWIEELEPLITKENLIQKFQDVERIHVSDPCIDYLQDILEKSRQLSSGLSPRGGRDFLKAGKAFAYLSGRQFLIPEDLQAVGVSVMAHRISNPNNQSLSSKDLAQEILFSVPVP